MGLKLNRYYIASLIWALIILILTLTPGKSVPDLKIFTYDKLGHLGIFLIQAYFFVSGLYLDKKSVTKSILWGLLLTVIYGAIIEIGQGYVPDRAMDWQDLVANCTGSVLGIAIFYASIKLNWQ